MGDLDQPRKRRKPRTPVACDTCRARKVKCDGAFPCICCTRHLFECSYKGKSRHLTASDHGGEITGRGEASIPHSRPIEPPEAQYATPSVSTPSHANAAPASSDSFGPSLPSASPSTRHSHRDAQIFPAGHKEEGVGEVNRHTNGAEFYGATGTFYFLSRLRSQASAQTPRQPEQAGTETSVVNLLHSSEYTVGSQSAAYSGSSPQPSASNGGRTHSFSRGSLEQPELLNVKKQSQIGREGVRLYFANLHHIHPILDQRSFISRCEAEIWLVATSKSQTASQVRFLALYSIVVAIGVVTADESSLVVWDGNTDSLEGLGGHEEQDTDDVPYLPIRIARLFFERAKALLEDTFESSSFETAQTLFLMSVFCQNALKPHSCYMYNGMAIRTAFAIGVPADPHADSGQQNLFWWALYSHEIEMCISAGRQSFLREPSQYRTPLPRPSGSSGHPASMVNCMVDLAHILIDVSANASRVDSPAAVAQRSSRASELDQHLHNWKKHLPTSLDFERWGIEDTEAAMKQKIVLKLRYLNARILIHRAFLITASTESYRQRLSSHTTACVDAAKGSIEFMHSTYLHRPYFRTWWYNCTYVLDATMVLLYVLVSDIYPISDDILQYIDKSLQIFASMKVLAVARRCAEIVKEVLTVVERLRHQLSEHQRLVHGTASFPEPLTDRSTVGHPNARAIGTHAEGFPFPEGDMYAGLMDTALVFNFLNFEDWNAWSETGFAQ
ncbi:hypothetical protein GQ53DRAFT_732392 [Thozetella sp. PMI_491]|nr:hypothetical protein GQ53DRAFT_732392 [Thozetella sp. PMI_491]